MQLSYLFAPQKSMLYHPTTTTRLYLPIMSLSWLAHLSVLPMSGSPHTPLNPPFPFPSFTEPIGSYHSSSCCIFVPLPLLPYLFITLTPRERGREHVVLISAQYLPYLDLVSNTSTFHQLLFLAPTQLLLRYIVVDSPSIIAHLIFRPNTTQYIY